MSSRSERSSPILCMTPQPQGQIRLAGSMISSIRGSAAGRLPMVRLIAGLAAPSPALAARVSFSASTSAKAMDRSSNASCLSSSESFSDRLPCRAWFNSAIHWPKVVCLQTTIGRCSCRRVISVSAATVSISASTAARCAAGIAERLMAGALCMGLSYHKTPAKTCQTKRLIHSAAAGGRASSALTWRQSSPANSASNWAWFSAITPSLIAGQVNVASSRRL